MHAAIRTEAPLQAIRTPPSRGERVLLIALVLGALLWSALAPTDRLTWLLEVVWVIAALPLLALTWRRFPLTRLLCWLLAAHALVLIHGGAFTYAQTPLGFWLRDASPRWDWRWPAIHGTGSAISCRASCRRSSPASCCCG